jgi:hypothetical protein
MNTIKIKFLETLFLLLACSSALAQYQQGKTVVATGGGSSTDGTYKMLSNVGEPSGTTSDGTLRIESGFLSDMGLTIPNLSTNGVTNILLTMATSGGDITDNGGAVVTARGVVWNTSPGPTIALSTKTTNGSGSGTFTSSITGLSSNNTYYVRAYATNSVGTAYGNEVSFTAIPTLPEWGLIAMLGLFAGFGGWFVFKKIV